MREPRAVQFWSVWAAVAALATALPAARLIDPARPAPSLHREPTAVAASAALPPRAEATAPAPDVADDRVLQELAEAQTSADRCQLCERLPASDDPRFTYAIASVLEHTRLKSVRACAAAALSQQPTVEARSWLVDLVDDPQTEVHRSALSALAKANDDAARIIVVEATHSEDLEIRIAAVLALLGAKRAEGVEAALAVIPALEDRTDLEAIIESLGESQDVRALPALKALVESADRESHRAAITALGELGSPLAIPTLDALLAQGSDEEFDLAVQALRQLEPATLLSKLRAQLDGGNAHSRTSAFAAILDSDAPEATALVHARLRSGDSDQQRLVLQHLARKPDPSFEAELSDLASEADGPLQGLAVQALRGIDSPSARAIVQRTESNSEEVALRKPKPGNRALLALARDTSESAQAELLRLLDKSESAPTISAAISRAPIGTVEQLLPRATSANRQQRYGVIHGLYRRGDPRFAATLRNALADSDASIREIALRALVELGDSSAASEVARLTHAEDSVDRALAAELLSTRSDEASTQQLAALATDPDAQVASNALHALDARSPELTQQVALRVFRAADRDTRQSLLDNSNGLRRSLLRPLNELALADSNDNVALAAIQGLTALEGPASARQLLAVASDSSRSSEVRVAAAQGLRQLGGPLARSNRALLDALGPADDPGEYTCETTQ